MEKKNGKWETTEKIKKQKALLEKKGNGKQRKRLKSKRPCLKRREMGNNGKD